jgi:uncharacterized protein YjbI with pentapeptide repeats
VLPLLMVSALVFLALGGTAFAAGSLARNSVGSVQIKANAVKASELGSAAVSSAKIRNGAVTGADVADGNLTGVDLADGSVTGDDLADASIGGRKIAGNSIGLQAVESSTQRYFTDVPTTQVLPTRGSDVVLNLNPQPLLQWVSSPAHAGLNLVQAQVSVRVAKTISVTCEIVVDGVVATRVHETITHSDALLADFSTVPLMTTASLQADSTVAARCTAGQANFASALLTSSTENYSVNPTTMVVTRVAR